MVCLAVAGGNMRPGRNTLLLGSLALCICMSRAMPGHAAASHVAGPTQRAASGEVTAGKAIPDIKVMDQDGNSRHFYGDLVKGKTVVVNFVYTTCTTICPPLGAMFGRLQKSLGSRLGKDVYLISISVDPVTDTPARLRAWAAQFGTNVGWTLVTGERADLNRLLRVLGTDTSSPENHSALVLIVNDKTGIWKRVYGLGSIAALTRSVREMMTSDPPSHAIPQAKEKR